MQLSDEVEGAPGDDVEIVMADRPSGDEQFPIVTSRGDATKKFGKETISSSKVRTESSRSPKKSRVTTRPSKPLTVIAADGRKSSSSLSIKSLSRASTSNAGIKYGIARTVILPQQAFTRARRLLAPKSKPIVWVSMPGDVQFIDQEERSRIEHWSMPAPDKSESLHEKVSDACLVGGSKVVVAYARGSQPISILSLPKDQDASPKMHSVVHELVPSPRHESKGLLRVCAVGKRKFVTGSVDKRLFLWKLESSSTPGDSPVAIPEELEINLKASITALAYGNSRKWLITATPTRLSINSLQTGERVMYPYLENVSNLHTHGQNENLLLIEVSFFLYTLNLLLKR
ncbi:hypothetical protein FRC17_010076 [Serendipita sp. 399]|nr:hypothetical protein FRC17_010076 [Serendipita sp. 399]